jgi:carbon-monoxide dehydrogenase medium subunit
MNLWKEYRLPTTISEAIQDLRTATKPVMPIAGGTDLLLDIKQGRHSPVHTLIDVTSVKEMNLVEIRGEDLFIGAAVPVNRIVHNELVRKHAQALVESCDLIAGPQVRNTATLGGNVAHALPAAEGTIALIALAAQAEIVNNTGMRQVPMRELFTGPGKSAINKNEELLSGFTLPLIQPNEGSCFNRIMRPQGVALPILNCAIWVARDGEQIKDIRIAVGPGGPTPFRAMEAENHLRAKAYSDQTFASMLSILLDEVKFRSSPRRASAEYRRMIVGSLLKKTLDTAWSRCA